MSTRVTVTTADGGVVAVKSATTPDEVANLACEAARLQRASHPGVVGFVEHRVNGGRAELRTRFAGEPLDRWRGTPAQAAGLVAAVAASAADLHDLGIVHGRIEASHVLLDATGRPRLCGFAPPGDDASPPDDVAALGLLLEVLIEQAIPRRGVRSSGFLRPRARAADQQALSRVVAHATDGVASRRPTARALARSILSAVPGAELAPVAQPSSEPAEPSPEVPAKAPDRPSDPPSLGTATAASFGRFDDPALGLDADVDQIFGDQTTAEVDELFVDREWDDRPGRARTGPSRRPERRPSRAARSRRRRRRPSGLAGAVIVLVLAVVAAGASAFRAGWPGSVGAQEPVVPPAPAAARPCAPTEPPAAGTAGTTGTVSAPGMTGTTATAGNAQTDGPVDVDGDGCSDPAVVGGGVVEAAGQRWAVGEPGDAVTIGDWDCDGTATPAVYRPSSGAVFVFSDWAAVDRPLATEAVAQVLGGGTVATVHQEPGGTDCDRLSVQLVAGGQRLVDVVP